LIICYENGSASPNSAEVVAMLSLPSQSFAKGGYISVVSLVGKGENDAQWYESNHFADRNGKEC
jgi:hypothetical protein